MAGRTPNISNTWPPSRRSRDSSSALSRLRPTDSLARTITMSPLVHPSIALDRAERAKSAQIANTCSNSKTLRLLNNSQPSAVAKHRGMMIERPASANSSNSNKTLGKSSSPLANNNRLQVATDSKKRCKLSSSRSKAKSNDHYELSNLERKNSFVPVSSLLDRLDCFNSQFFNDCSGTTFCVEDKFEYIK